MNVLSLQRPTEVTTIVLAQQFASLISNVSERQKAAIRSELRRHCTPGALRAIEDALQAGSLTPVMAAQQTLGGR